MLGAASVAAALVAGCGGGAPMRTIRTTPDAAARQATPISAPQPRYPHRAPLARDHRLVRWRGVVEHLFFHTLVIHPRLAFRHDTLGQGFRDYFVTVHEFRAILAQLYAHRWTLVDLHRVVSGRVWVPKGRRPFVLSEDDVNYYDYSRPRGLGWRLVLDAHGQVKVEEHDGRVVRVTSDDIVPIVDAFVAQHPDFSANGAKGVLAVTGYEGILGERVNERGSPQWRSRVARARAVAARLRATGWTFASHSYGHIDVTQSSADLVRRDALRWLAEAVPIVGRTDVYIYPFGAQPPPGSPQVQALRALGFTVQCGIDIAPRLVRADGVTFMSRRHIDGIAFSSAQQRAALAPMFSVKAVEDVAARR
jgi:peptidoglycan/xylan/chitin deacetylase (PgdA/CDA1 family)